MYHYKQVIDGLVQFVDRELVTKMTGLNRWLFGTGAGIVGSKAEKVFHNLKEISLLQTLELIEDDNINIHCIYTELLKQAAHGPIHIEISMLGTITLDKTDVEKMYHYIIED